MRFILYLFLFLGMLEGRESKQALDSLFSKDKEKIEFLFSHLVRYENLGFVLFGETKAAAYCTLPLRCNYPIYPSSISDKPLKYQNYLKQCWMVWMQQRHKFPHPNLIICEEYDLFHEGFFLQLFFINKQRLYNVIDTYHEDFEEVLGENFSKEKFLLALEQKGKLRPLLKHDEKLLGLILGFGRESSAAFEDFDETVDLESFKRVGYRPCGCMITPVSFMGNPNSEEVKSLVERYTDEIQKIDALYRSERFFEEFLKKFCSGN